MDEQAYTGPSPRDGKIMQFAVQKPDGALWMYCYFPPGTQPINPDGSLPRIVDAAWEDTKQTYADATQAWRKQEQGDILREMFFGAPHKSGTLSAQEFADMIRPVRRA